MKEIVENGQTYIVDGDYPDGPYVKYIKNRGELQRTVISRYAFRQRLTFDEKVLLKSSEDVGVQVLIEDLMSATEVDLNDDGFKLGMLYLNSVLPDVFTEERIAELSEPE